MKLISKLSLKLRRRKSLSHFTHFDGSDAAIWEERMHRSEDQNDAPSLKLFVSATLQLFVISLKLFVTLLKLFLTSLKSFVTIICEGMMHSRSNYLSMNATLKLFETSFKLFVTLAKLFETSFKLFVTLAKLFVTSFKLFVTLVKLFDTLLKLFLTSLKIFVTLQKLYVGECIVAQIIWGGDKKKLQKLIFSLTITNSPSFANFSYEIYLIFTIFDFFHNKYMK